MSVQVTVKGIEEVRDMLKGLSVNLKKKVLIAALRKAAKPIVKAAKQNAPVYNGKPRVDVIPGLVKKTIAANRSKIHNGRRGTIGLYIRPQGSKKLKIAQRGAKRIGSTALKGYDPYYYKFQESGFTSPSGRKIEGRGFIQKAFESNKYRVINTISDYVIAEVKKQKAKNA